jgi:putative ABC transport system substrate-binding protein
VRGKPCARRYSARVSPRGSTPFLKLVREAGFEPARSKALPPEDSVSTFPPLAQVKRMKRREFLMLLSLAASRPVCGFAASTATIGVLTVGVPSPEEFLVSFREGLRNRGYIEGQNIQIDVQSAEGHADRLPELAAELVRRKVAVIIGFQTPTVTAAKQATTEIPIVMDAGDPVGMGIVQSLSKPGGNITGISAATAEVGPKNLQLLQQIVPSLKRAALFLNKTDPFRIPFLDHNQRGADELGIELKPIFIDGVTELASAFDTATSENLEAVLIQPSLPISRAAAFALTHHLPTASPTRGFVSNGGLLSYCANYEEVWRQMATYVAKILKGARPSDLPVEQPTKFEFLINGKTAKALGLTIPPLITSMADEVIE